VDLEADFLAARAAVRLVKAFPAVGDRVDITSPIE